MLKRIFSVLLVFGIGNAGLCHAQLCETSHATDLYCLLPSAFHTAAEPFNAFYTPFGTELSQLPTAKPAGLVLAIEHGQLVPAHETLGAIFSERAETVGPHRLLLSFGYQRFDFGSIDGTNLKNVPIVLTCSGACVGNVPNVVVYTVTNNRFDIKANQYSALAVFGLTKTFDVSAAIPFERIAMSVAVNGTEYSSQGAMSANFQEYVPGSSAGIADVVVGAKWKVFDRSKVRLAPGIDVRLPSGDELNFLGSGAIGVKPYLAASVKAPVSVHGNIGYQWNGSSILNANTQGAKQQLPTDLVYSLGVDADIVKNRLTLIGDILGQRYDNAPRLAQASSVPVPILGTATSVEPVTNAYTVNNLALGAKVRPFSHLIFTGNATIKLNSAGLRSTVVPLVGLAYSF